VIVGKAERSWYAASSQGFVLDFADGAFSPTAVQLDKISVPAIITNSNQISGRAARNKPLESVFRWVKVIPFVSALMSHKTAHLSELHRDLSRGAAIIVSLGDH